MRTKSVWGVVGLVVALSLAAGSAFYLWRAQETIEQAVTPVDVAAPQLFPEDTALFLAIHRVDERYADFEHWWKKFEPTAAYRSLSQAWEKQREQLPGEVAGPVEKLEQALDETEKRLGYRPTTRDFFETYGRYSAIGALATGTGSAFLVVTRLPDDAAAGMLESTLDRFENVRRRDELIHGYPAFEESTAGGKTTFYGVGGGFLFIAQRLPDLDGALGRMRALHDGAAAQSSLADAAVFQRGVPGPWESVRFAMYAKRNQNFAGTDERLKLLDEFFANGFVLAPNDPAIAVSAVVEADGWAMKSSFAKERSGDWTQLVPAGASQVEQQLTTDEATLRAARAAEIEAVENLRLWKEADALLGDASRLHRLIEEALPADMRPEPATVERLSHDARLIADLWRASSEAALFTPPPRAILATKTYVAGTSKTSETVIGLEADPLSVFSVASLLGLAEEHAREWVRRREEPGAIAWTVKRNRVLEMLSDMPENAAEMIEPTILGALPTMILGSGRIWICFGANMADEVFALAAGTGGTPLSDDPVFREAIADLEPGYLELSYVRPAEVFGAMWAGYRDATRSVVENLDAPEAVSLLDGGFAVVDDLLAWESQVRAQVTATYPDRSSRRLVLMDPQAEAGSPEIELPPGPLDVAGALPEQTWALLRARMQTEEAYERLAETYVRGVGGQARWDELVKDSGMDVELADRVVDKFVKGIRGEVGAAMVVPAAPPVEGEFTTQNAIQRMPALVLFAEFEDAPAALGLIADAFETLHDAANEGEEPFQERHRRWMMGEGRQPRGTQFVQNETEVASFCALDIIIPQGRQGYAVPSFVAVRRGKVVYLTHSVPVFQHLIGVPGTVQRTLAERLAADLPQGALPEATSFVTLVRPDGLLDTLRLYVDPLLPAAPMLTLRGYERRPPEDRMQAHLEGWTTFIDLVDEALRTHAWSVTVGRRTGDRVDWVETMHRTDR